MYNTAVKTERRYYDDLYTVFTAQFFKLVSIASAACAEPEIKTAYNDFCVHYPHKNFFYKVPCGIVAHRIEIGRVDVFHTHLIEFFKFHIVCKQIFYLFPFRQCSIAVKCEHCRTKSVMPEAFLNDLHMT